MLIPDPDRHYPSAWAKYNGKHTLYLIPPQFPNPTETYRFGARYRAAKAYKGAQFEAYSDGATARGYSSLLALVLAFSAFEYFYKEVLRLDVPGINKLFREEHSVRMLQYQNEFGFIVRSAESDLLFRTIRSHLNHRLQVSIDEMLSGKDVNLIRVLAALRHAFVHGHLTPGIAKLPASVVTDLCRFGYVFLMDMMDQEFTRRIEWEVDRPE